MVREGSEDDVKKYLASAEKTIPFKQSELDECLNIGIKQKEHGVVKLLVNAGASMQAPINEILVFSSGDSAITNMFLEHYECNGYLDYSPASILLGKIDYRSNRGLYFVNRVLPKLQELNIRLDVERLAHEYPFHNVISRYDGSYQDTEGALVVEETVRLLCRHGFDINGVDSTEETSLHCAARLGNVSGVRALIKNGANLAVKNSRGVYPWMAARDESVMQELLQGLTLSEPGGELLHGACKGRSEPAVRYLLHSGVDVNYKDDKNRTPLITALQNPIPTVGVIQCLVQHPLCDVNFDNGAAIRNALKCGNTNDRIAVANLLLQAGASINIPDSNGYTLLMDKVIYSRETLYDWLLQNGADVNAVAGDGCTALWTAVNVHMYIGVRPQQGHFIVDLLSQNIEIAISQHQHRGVTPLQLAFQSLRYDSCRLLLNADCSLRGMRDYLSRTQDRELGEDLQRMRTRILELCAEPYSLKVQARLAVLRAIGQCDLKKTLHRIHSSGLLPKALVNYLGKSIEFNVDSFCDQ